MAGKEIFMQKKLLAFIIIGVLVTSVLGTLFHFTYDWSGQNFLVGLFTPVSESTWEHMKLLFFPMLLYGILAAAFVKQDYPCIFNAYPLGILSGTFAIPVMFYTYTGIVGRNYTPIDILIFYLSVILAFVIVYFETIRCQKLNSYLRKNPVIPWLLVLLLAACFLAFCVVPPSLGIFREGLPR